MAGKKKPATSLPRFQPTTIQKRRGHQHHFPFFASGWASSFAGAGCHGESLLLAGTFDWAPLARICSTQRRPFASSLTGFLSGGFSRRETLSIGPAECHIGPPTATAYMLLLLTLHQKMRPFYPYEYI
ncbi:hypothetical protein TWF569_011095 [Orbilia oligospora]|uniref:Uncharacterized protein n=1 Tax=Orbilia oligospora TaxID=2813651 RepID=A0A7C8NAY6_ORBOL|nr:hypothetical protein TWF102_007978 [Orbilia oligospora]KAF3108422.1 hypothetical protein TWF103_005506 [Orbilia oligospora]KAF3131647.1 hypothetical protein TWF569_011095 [Orbilia oligospora]